MQLLTRMLIVIVFALGCSLAQARQLSGVVTHVSDGDTLWVRLASNAESVKVRFQGIDAPESCQAWGGEATAALTRKTLHHTVVLDIKSRDTYGRLLARVHRGREDVGAWMVSQGHAWSNHFHTSQGPYAAQENSAKAARRGLWHTPAPIEPRAFRKLYGPCPTR